jgi:iron complex transport system substrate-binding protein
LKTLFFVLLLSLQIFSYDRVVALSPAINVIIFAIEAQEKIVANTTYCNYPKESLKKQKVGGYFSPNLEKIVALKPDIVFMQENKAFAKKLSKLGIKTKVFKLQKIDDIKKSIIMIGELLNKKEKALEITQKIERKLTALKGIVKNKRVLIVIGHNLKLDKKVFVVGHNLYLEDIIKISGNKNAFNFKTLAQPTLNLENIITLNPDIVILLSPYMKKKRLTKKDLLKAWKNLPINASKHKTIYVEFNEYAGIPSQRLIYFLDDFKAYLEDAKLK